MNWWTGWKERLGQSWVRALYRSAGVRRVFWGLLFGALLTVLLASQVIPARLNIQEGDVSPVDIEAPRDIINRVETERRREEAASRVQPVMVIDPEVAGAAEAELRRIFADIRSVRQRVAPPAEEGESGTSNRGPLTQELIQQRMRELGTILPQASESQLRALATADDETIRRLESETVAQALRLLSRAIRPEEVEAVRAQVQNAWVPEGVDSRELIYLARDLVRERIRSNLKEDQEATERAREQARQSVPPVIVKQRQRIVSKGEVITHEQYQMLVDLELVGPRADALKLLGVALFSYLVVGLMGYYLWRYRPDLLERENRILIIGLVGLVTCSLAILALNFSGYLMPWAAGTMLLAILIDTRVALVMSLLFTLLAGVITQGELLVTAASAVASFVGVYSVRRVEARATLIQAGLWVGAAVVVTILALHLVTGGSLMDLSFWRDVLLVMVGALFAAVLAVGSLPILESLFGVLTPIKLLELANPNHPLLKRVLMEAPGTYHHTLMVANLCEAAAEAVGADAMLCRVGAYYHDIGKVKRPLFFSENQFGGENPHDRLPPHVSAMIIAAHVKDGVELAREYRLPEEIIDFIREHHGDMLISYFYHKATQNGTGEHVLEQDFRYEGPRPRRKETAICMLADGCEASVRALRSRGPLSREQIEAQVEEIVNSRLAQGQLSNSDLTLRDLEIIKRTFVRVLEGVHHGRIEYPKLDPGSAGPAGATPGELPAPPAGQGKEPQRSGDSDQQPAG